MKIINPFYSALLVVGLAFALTTCAYTVMSFRELDPFAPEEQELIAVMKNHGLLILVSQLSLLGVLTVAAIGSDDYWTKRADSKTTPKTPE
jgi:hypothetical protein